MKRRRLLERIALLCQCGAGLEAIASPFVHAVRDLLNADASSLFWMTAEGQPLGFYHSNAPPEMKDLYITQIDEKFLLSEPVNIVDLAAPEGPVIGKALAPGVTERFWQGNIYRYLCAPLNHRYLLDMRADAGPVGRACAVTWSTPDSPFTAADAEALQAVQPLMQAALAERGGRARWRSVTNGTAHMVVRPDGAELVSIGPEAERILMQSHLLGQDLSMTSAPRRAPGFAQILARQMQDREVAELSLSVTDGRIHAKASRTALIGPGGATEPGLFIALDMQAAEEVVAVDRLMALDLTPLQRRIALYAVQGGSRDRCEAQFGVSGEALKKHLRGLYQTTGAANWSGLDVLRA